MRPKSRDAAERGIKSNGAFRQMAEQMATPSSKSSTTLPEWQRDAVAANKVGKSNEATNSLGRRLARAALYF